MSKKIRFQRKPRKCPSCESRRIAIYLYGMPMFDEKLQIDLDEGRIVLGGCCIAVDDPVWRCAECGADFWKNLLEQENVDLGGDKNAGSDN